jgi:PHD/YefM family antitoxin component YafN of YafNO toxin-antitoxin module
MDSELNQQVVLLMGGAVVKVQRTAHGATVLVTDEDTGEMVLADTAQFQHLRETVERLNDENIELRAKYDRMDRGYQQSFQRDWKLFGADRQKWSEERAKLHAQRLELFRRATDATARAHAAERLVQELKDKVEALEQALDYGQPNPYSV